MQVITMETVLKQIAEKNKAKSADSKIVLNSERARVVKGSNRYKERV